MDIFSLCAPWPLLSVCVCGGGGMGRSRLSGISSYKDTNPVGLELHTYDLILLYFLLVAPSPDTATLGVRASTYEFWEVGAQTFSP